jgi:hypothetical protein
MWLVGTTKLVSEIVLSGLKTTYNPDMVPLFVHHDLWQYIKDGGTWEYCMAGNSCSQTFMGTK